MHVKDYINTTRERVVNKELNIIVPICLGNKFFSIKNVVTDNVRKYIEWAAENTKEKILVLVVDKIQDTNYFIRNSHRTEAASRRRVLKDGKEILLSISSVIKNLPNHTQKKIALISYEEYEKSDPYCKDVTIEIHKEFKDNKAFNGAVLNSVKTSVRDRVFSEEEYQRLCNYVLDEFSLVYAGAEYKGDYYGLYVYPETDSVVDLIYRIQVGESFKELQAKLPQRKIGLVTLSNT